MQVIEAVALGMCFGVRDALTAMDGLPDPATATLHGELVHNPRVLQQLALRGFQQRGEDQRGKLPDTPRVVITAHGISDREKHRLLDAGKTLIDTTCPLVRRVHEAAQWLQAEGRFVVVLGKPGHVEVQGIVDDLDEYAVVPAEPVVRRYPSTRLGIVCQTTLPPRQAEDLVAAIRRKNPQADIRFIDTICQPTKERQMALVNLLPRVEALIVIGGRHSNNTRELVRLAEAAEKPAVHIESAEDLVESWCRQFRVVGLTAGTSTLGETIDEVRAKLRQWSKEVAHAA